jgi:hypothetical protein
MLRDVFPDNLYREMLANFLQTTFMGGNACTKKGAGNAIAAHLISQLET